MDKNELLELYEQLKEQHEYILQKIAEYNIIKESIQEIKDEKDTYVNIGGMVFVKADIKDTNNLLVNIGDNIFIEKTKEEVLETIESTLKNLENTKRELENQMNELKEKIQSL